MAAGLAYWFSAPWHPFPGSIVLKGLAVSALAFLVWPESKLLGVALAFSSLGDILLDLKNLFVWGLGSFLITHLLYITLFRRFWPPGRPSTPRLLAMTSIAAFSAGFLSIMKPLGSMRIPVYVYIGAITGMVLSSLRGKWSTPWVVCGALLFFVSDSILGFNLFVWELPFRSFLVWPTYYGGQLAVTLGMLAQFRSAARTKLK